MNYSQTDGKRVQAALLIIGDEMQFSLVPEKLDMVLAGLYGTQPMVQQSAHRTSATRYATRTTIGLRSRISVRL